MSRIRLLTLLTLAGALLLAVALPAARPVSAQTVVNPSVAVVAVEKDVSITIRAFNFPANQAITARMSATNVDTLTQGTVVGTFGRTNGEFFTATFPMPESLRGQPKVAVRLDSADGKFAYNWDNNTTRNGGRGCAFVDAVTIATTTQRSLQGAYIGTGSGTDGAYIGTGTIAGAATTLVFGTDGAYIGTGAGTDGAYIGTGAGTDGAYIGTGAGTDGAYIGTGAGTTGAYIGTGAAPDAAQTTLAGSGTLPYFEIGCVEANGMIVVEGQNFPADTLLTARMGRGTLADATSTVVGYYFTGAGGAIRVGLMIPEALDDVGQVAVRLETAFAYGNNWFYNSYHNNYAAQANDRAAAAQ